MAVDLDSRYIQAFAGHVERVDSKSGRQIGNCASFSYQRCVKTCESVGGGLFLRQFGRKFECFVLQCVP